MRKQPTYLLWIFGPTATLYDVAGGARTLGPGELTAALRPLRSGTLIVLMDTTLARPILCTMPPLKRGPARQLIQRYLHEHGPLLAYDLGALKNPGPLERPLLCIQDTPLAEPWFQILARHAALIHTWTALPLVIHKALNVSVPHNNALLAVTRVDQHVDQVLLWQGHCWLTRHHPFLETALASDIQASLTHAHTLGIAPQTLTVCSAGITVSRDVLREEGLVIRDFSPTQAARNLLNAASTEPLPALHVPVFEAYRRDKKIAWSGALIALMSSAVALFFTLYMPESAPTPNPAGDTMAQEISDLQTQISVLGGEEVAFLETQDARTFYSWRTESQKHQISPNSWRQKIRTACPDAPRLSRITFQAPRVTPPSVPAPAETPTGILQLETYLESPNCDPTDAIGAFEVFQEKLANAFPDAQVDALRMPQDTPHCPGSIVLFLPLEVAP